MTVKELIEELSELPMDMPVVSRMWGEAFGTSGEVRITVEPARRACQEAIDSFSGAVHWFDLGTKASEWNEARGGTIEQVARIYS